MSWLKNLDIPEDKIGLNKKWLLIGTNQGNHLKALYDMLMNRYGLPRVILEDILYVIEPSPIDAYIASQIVDPGSCYDLNITCTDDPSYYDIEFDLVLQ